MTHLLPKTLCFLLISTALCLALLPASALAGEGSWEEQEEAVLLLNDLRERRGLAPLHWNPSSQLQEAARVRAREIARSFSHTRPDGRSCGSVLDDFGIAFSRWGENIAYGTRMTPARAIGSWSRSQGHRENMLEPRFREVGLASWHDGQGNVYWIQIFLTR